MGKSSMASCNCFAVFNLDRLSGPCGSFVSSSPAVVQEVYYLLVRPFAEDGLPLVFVPTILKLLALSEFKSFVRFFSSCFDLFWAASCSTSLLWMFTAIILMLARFCSLSTQLIESIISSRKACMPGHEDSILVISSAI